MSGDNGRNAGTTSGGGLGGGGGEIPAVITTAHLLLRGLIPAFVGCSIGDVDNNGGGDGGGLRASAFQMTYRKDLPKLGVQHGE